MTCPGSVAHEGAAWQALVRDCLAALPSSVAAELLDDLPLVEVLDDVDGVRDGWIRVVHHGLVCGDAQQPLLAAEVDALRRRALS